MTLQPLVRSENCNVIFLEKPAVHPSTPLSEIKLRVCFLLSVVYSLSLLGFSGETSAMLEIVWQPIVLHLIECITTAAKFTGESATRSSCWCILLTYLVGTSPG